MPFATQEVDFGASGNHTPLHGKAQQAPEHAEGTINAGYLHVFALAMRGKTGCILAGNLIQLLFGEGRESLRGVANWFGTSDLLPEI